MKLFLLWLKWMWRKWQLGEARAFRYGLENTINRERLRAKDWLEHAELMERRAELEIIAARVDRQRELRT